MPFKATAVPQSHRHFCRVRWLGGPRRGAEGPLSLAVRCLRWHSVPSAPPFVILSRAKSSGLWGPGQAAAIFPGGFGSIWVKPWEISRERAINQMQFKAAKIYWACTYMSPWKEYWRSLCPRWCPQGSGPREKKPEGSMWGKKKKAERTVQGGV